MRNILKILPATLFFALFLSGCFKYGSLPKHVECPVPEQECVPAKWVGVEIDTSKDAELVMGFYWVIKPVENVNTPADEWKISFRDDNKAYLTFSDGPRQRMMTLDKVKVDRFNIASGVNLPIEGHAGAISERSGAAVFSAAFAEFQAETVKLASIEDSIPVEHIPLPSEYILGNSKLYEAKRGLSGFSNARRIPADINLSDFTWESHPALSPDGKVLFFASDRNMQSAGVDIFFAVKTQSGEWSQPINCGDTINTACDDLTPFVEADGSRLFFASAGHDGVGGYDVFSVDISESFWRDSKRGDLTQLSRPNKYFSYRRNLRPPMNTPADELFPSCPGDCDSALYYASNQAGADGYDIFVKYKATIRRAKTVAKREDKVDFDYDVEVDEPDVKIEEEIITYPTIELSGSIYNANTKKPVADAEVVARPTDETAPKETRSNAEGEYAIELDKNVQYEITAQSPDLFYDSFAFFSSDTDPQKNARKDFFLPEKFSLRINFPFDNYDNPYRYALDSNGIETSRVWTQELDLLAENILTSEGILKKIVLVGHTDDQGSESYNIKLGERRVEFVAEQLANRGVPKDLLETRSAGEAEPLASRPGEDLSLYRKRLRRVVIEKIFSKK